MRHTHLSAIVGSLWLLGAGASLSLVVRWGAVDPIPLACAAIAATCFAGTLALGTVADLATRAARRSTGAEAILAALPVPAALHSRSGACLGASVAWEALTDTIPPVPAADGRHDIEISGRPHTAHVTTFADGSRASVLVRAGAVIPGPALERFARALLVEESAFRFGPEEVASIPALAAFNQILAAQMARGRMRAPAFTHSQARLVQDDLPADRSVGDAPPDPEVACMGDGDDMAFDGTEIALSDSEFTRIRDKVQRIAGISLSDAKRTLVVSRLSKIVRGQGLASFSAYLDRLERAKDPADLQAFVNALTTNLTRFWREDHHFDHLVGHVGTLMARRPRLAPNGKPRLRIWSAGCSTGQEPYTIALALLDAHPELARWDFKILATDIDSDVLTRAAGGVYPASELNGLSPERARLFDRAPDGGAAIPPRARDLVSFRRLNLMVPAWPFKGPFDAIFCRNVAIYFDKPTQGALFDRLGTVLAPDGFLYIGHSENLTAVSKGFRLVGKTVYQREPAKAAGSARDAA